MYMILIEETTRFSKLLQEVKLNLIFHGYFIAFTCILSQKSVRERWNRSFPKGWIYSISSPFRKNAASSTLNLSLYLLHRLFLFLYSLMMATEQCCALKIETKVYYYLLRID